MEPPASRIAPDAGPDTLSIREIIDHGEMTRRRWFVVALCFAIALLDGLDTQSIAFIGPAIAEEFGMQATDMTWVITASTIGMIGMTLGAIGLGSVGDRIGRRKAIMIAMALFGVFSLLGAYARSPAQIIALRFLIGLGMGGATPSLLALTAEYSTARRRALLMTTVLIGLPFGALLGGLVAANWLPVIGWRGIFLLGGALPLALLILCAVLLPESPGFLVARKTTASMAKARRVLRRMTGQPVPDGILLIGESGVGRPASIGGLFAPRYRMATLAISAIYLFNWIAWFLLLLWLPTALTALGLAKADAAYGTVTVNGAFIAMSLPLSMLMGRIAVRPLLLTMFATGMAVAIGMGLAGSNWTLLFVLIALAGFGIGGQQLVLNYLIANTYPTQLRATATGWGIGIGRLGAIVGSALGGTLVSVLGPSGYFASLAVPLLLAAVAVLLVRENASTRAVQGPNPANASI